MERARDCPRGSRGPEGRVGRECDNEKVGKDLLWRRLQGESVDCSRANPPTIELANRSGISQSLGAGTFASGSKGVPQSISSISSRPRKSPFQPYQEQHQQGVEDCSVRPLDFCRTSYGSSSLTSGILCSEKQAVIPESDLESGWSTTEDARNMTLAGNEHTRRA